MDHKVPVNPKWPRRKVAESSQIQEIAHDPDSETMYIHFSTNDSVYSYKPVTSKQFEAFMNAPSAGAYFHKHFKKNNKIKTKSM